MRSGVEEQWRLLGAVERVVGEVAVEFDGWGAALPLRRHVLDHSREELGRLAAFYRGGNASTQGQKLVDRREKTRRRSRVKLLE